ncbi:MULTISPECIES: O-antigen polymerase [Marinobacter]|uniref:O-antigen polymerase n=1 Tax=Marinobacter TaxID=2742 RepID=UPI0013737416|nr:MULTISPECIES: O-antigen polymerase [unclassified Marinobacter]
MLFSLSSLPWLITGYGYSIDYEGFLAAKAGFYSASLEVLSIKAMSLFVLGYLSFIAGASVKTGHPAAGHFNSHRNPSLISSLKIVSWVMILLAALNFSVNVVMISGGNILDYLSNTAGRSYQVAEGQGISAIGYIFGLVGVNFIFYFAGKENTSKKAMLFLLMLLVIFILVRASQGRIFQTLVFIGSTYVCYLIAIHQSGRVNASYVKSIPVFLSLALLGVALYFLRILSAYFYSGKDLASVDFDFIFSGFMHFAVERGNVPNVPILLTLIDKIPEETFYFAGSTIPNFLLWLIPKSLLAPDYLISLRIKELWYLDIPGGGLPPTGVGEWYANFGIAGVFVGMFLVGFTLKYIYSKALSGSSPYLKVIWANLSIGFIVIYPKTDLSQIPSFIILVVGIFWLCAGILHTIVRPKNIR